MGSMDGYRLGKLLFDANSKPQLKLGKDRLPKRIQPISTTQIKFVAAPDKTLTPWQYIGNDKIELDYPTFIYVALDQSLLDAYSSSPIESAIKPVIYSEQFSNDITRIVGKVIHPRQKVRINEEQVRKFLSPGPAAPAVHNGARCATAGCHGAAPGVRTATAARTPVPSEGSSA